ncbi:acyltransferase family protein [Roseomonas sp. CCTCC AB2023176]|uniref:acyltransferase family protein n=1 Tax=Roseomonas sp. CCTCC AB2023176 TaxID=3342640 RepID=UPI0035E14A33
MSEILPPPVPRAANAVIADIQTLRGVSILLVLVAHLPFLYPWADAAFRVVGPYGFGYGVDLFFVISGFVITRSLATELRSEAGRHPASVVLRFWVRRAFRLWPAAALAVAATLAFVAAIGHEPPLPATGDTRSYVQAALAGLLNYMNLWAYRQVTEGRPITLLAHFWSLSLEEQFYVVLPLLMLGFHRSRVLPASSLGVILAFAWIDRSDFRHLPWWFRVDGLFWGVLVSWVSERPWVSRRQFGRIVGGLVLGLSIIGLVLSPAVAPASGITTSTTLLLAVLPVLVASLDGGAFQHFGWLSRCLNAIGERSYTLYLWHLLAFTAAQLAWRRFGSQAAEPDLVGVTCITLLAAVALTACCGAYRWIELPTRAAGRRAAEAIAAAPQARMP